MAAQAAAIAAALSRFFMDPTRRITPLSILAQGRHRNPKLYSFAMGAAAGNVAVSLDLPGRALRASALIRASRCEAVDEFVVIHLSAYLG